ncbi:MAG: hypothetical protein ACTSR2_04755 [Candidatus Hodarchaeales archaeon]
MPRKDKDFATLQMVNDATKTMIAYMKDLTNAIERLDYEIKVIKNRLDQLQGSSKHQSPLGAHRPIKQTKRTSHLPEPPRVVYSQANDLKSELETVIHGGIKLKSVKQGKEEELQELRSAVHEEFKRKRINTNESQSDSISDLKSQLTRDLEESLNNILKKKKKRK